MAVREKVGRLPRFFDRTTGIDVIVDLEPAAPQVEVRVSAEETNDFFAADQGANVFAALDRVVQKLEQQLNRHKEKLTGRRGRNQPPFEALGE
jgi:putative sigma-54 modulation protein